MADIREPQLAVLAVSLLAWLRLIALDGQLAKAEPKALRFRLLSAPARMVTHVRRAAAPLECVHDGRGVAAGPRR